MSSFCKNDWFSSRKPNDRKLGHAIRFAQRANRDAQATGTSEVSTHRISKAKNSLPGWTGSPKWARRRETLGSSIALLKSSVRIIGSKHDDGDAISSGSALRGCTRFRVCEWQSLGMRISRVRRVARLEQTLALRGIRSGRHRDRRIGARKGAMQMRRFPKQEIDECAIGASKGAQRFSQWQAFRARSRQKTFTSLLGGEPRPAGQPHSSRSQELPTSA